MKHGRHLSYLAAFLVTWVSGCGTPVDPDQEPTPAGAAPFIVSDAAFVGPSDVSGSAGLEPVVFVSLPPGTLSGGRTISIRVDRSGAVVSAALLDGGLDPVAVPAVEGDLLSLTVTSSGGSISHYKSRVPPRKPPVIVRTDPEKNKRDVPLNLVVQAVFSEPIDAASLTPQNFELLAGGNPVAGQITFANPAHTTVSFIPAEELKPGSEYELVLHTGVRDLDGASLERVVRIPFITAQAGPTTPSSFVISNAVTIGSASGPRVFVSLAPGSPGFLSVGGLVGVEARSTGVPTALAWSALRDGGLDPLAVAASAGHELLVSVYSATAPDRTEAIWRLTVPLSQPPVLIRTTPRNGQTVAPDVPIQAIFSEPIDPASLTAENFAVRLNGDPFGGELRFANQEQTVVEFTPAAALQGASEYELVLGPGIRDLDGAHLETLSRASFITAPRSTPPAGTLAFVRDGQIYRVNTDGSGLTQLTTVADGVSDRDPAWSPDGQRLAFGRGEDAAGGIASRGIYVMNADGSNVVQLTSGGTEPAWSPDGRTIAFTGGPGIAAIDVEGGEERILIDRRGYNATPAWSPDGQTITFTSDWRAYDFVYDIYAIDADGSGAQPLVEGPFFGWPLAHYWESAWSPDGNQIALGRCEYDFNCAIALVNPDGSGLTVLAQWGRRPTWSPDGATIAFEYSSCLTCRPSIRFARADGSDAGLIVTNGHSPAWRPR